ncbi:putative protein TPRXL [Zingiber officinale]|uniref:VQ domain-containing protein n=1 Tax=Zingiber officinale TaxID=94328 RepID=A0A8J5LDU2_ZINOF|nr:putative protein TPRXL [Zingiber officinale]KAG6524473.1 hypothetical protein ZIOFF_014382 [Zingiber officinale]
MDSGNTSSLHSSSGGGGGGSEDVDSLSAFFHTSASPSGVALPTPLPPSSSVGSHFLDYYSLFYHDSSSSSPAPHLPSASGSQPSTAEVEAQADPPAAPPPRNSRKRSRASRRAPTTVLTTDTSNFRAMVQEFTGIPAAPFAAPSVSSSLFLRPRIDQFLHPSSSSSAAASPFLLRPFLHKPHSPPSFTNPIPNPPSLPPSLNLTNTASTSASAALSNPISNQLPPNLHSLLHPPIPPTFFASDDFAALHPALFVPDPATSNWAGVDFSGAGVSRPHISVAGSCKPSYASPAAPVAERVIGEKPEAEVAGRNSDNAAEPSWIRSSSD